ncbi:MAG: GH92 family glycosyl hydrolase [Nannocystaceae bacterium]
MRPLPRLALALSLAPIVAGCSGPGGEGSSATVGEATGASTSAAETETDADTTTEGTTDATTGEDDTPYPWPEEALIAEVEPRIGSGGLGYKVGTINPGASMPFGMIKPGPDTGLGGLQLSFLNCTGYHYDQTHLWGFSHSRINGMGVPDYGALLITPTIGIDDAKVTLGGARSAFDHAEEEASPGYYAATLEDVGVRAELSATPRVALHRYTWDEASDEATVLLNLGYNPGGGASTASSVTIDEAGATIKGMTTVMGGYSNRFGGVPTYFVARFSRPFTGLGVWDDAMTLSEGTASLEGAQIGAWARFSVAADEPLGIAVAISYVSIEEAEANLAAEAPDLDFDGARAAAEAAWEADLRRVRVLGGDETERRIFYSALYHAFLAPTTFNDASGAYRGFDGEVHQADGFTYYSDFSLWDTYRTLHPLLNLVQRDRSGEMMRSLTRMYEDGGDLPKWPLAFGYTGGMVGTSADTVLADAHLKEVGGFDPVKAYEGARLHATAPRSQDGRAGIEGYMSRGWVASDESTSAASRTLEFSIADNALAAMAASLGYSDDAAVFTARSRSYQNLWEPGLGFLIGRRADGTFEVDGFDADAWQGYYAEGTAWHYLWMVPHDAAGLASLMGGEVAARERLAAYMEMSAQYLNGPGYSPNNPVPYYWQSNEPSLHDVYLFTDFGDPASTQRWTEWARQRHYSDAPDGLPGNDDAGTMSAWYVWSAIGLYPNPGTPNYWITAPIFERVELAIGDAAAPGRRLTILAEGAGPGMTYVESAKWNGVALDGPTIPWDRLREGGTLRLGLSAAPTDFGAR